MSAEESRPEFVRTQLIQELLSVADRVDALVTDSPLPPIVASWLRREAHLAEERQLATLAAGLPQDTAQFLSFDDPGFQLAAAYAAEYDERWPA